MLSMMRFCRAAEIATCDISSEFSSAGRKHAAEFTTCAGGKHPGEIKGREVELGSHSWMDCLAAELFLNSCFSDTMRFCSALLLKHLAGSPPA